MNNCTPFRQHEIEVGIRLRKEGRPWSEIASCLGRNQSTVQKRINYEMMTPEAKAEYRKRKEANRKARPPRKSIYIPMIAHDDNRPKFKPSAEQLAERDRVSSEPMTLSAILFGDPPPSRSALAQKVQNGTV